MKSFKKACQAVFLYFKCYCALFSYGVPFLFASLAMAYTPLHAVQPEDEETALSLLLKAEADTLNQFDQCEKKLSSDSLELKRTDNKLRNLEKLLGHREAKSYASKEAPDSEVTALNRKEEEVADYETLKHMRDALHQKKERNRIIQGELEKSLGALKRIRQLWEEVLPEIQQEEQLALHLQQLNLLQSAQNVQLKRTKLQKNYIESLLKEIEIIENLYCAPASDSMGLKLREELKLFPSTLEPRIIRLKIEELSQEIFEGPRDLLAPYHLKIGTQAETSIPTIFSQEDFEIYQKIHDKCLIQIQRYSRFLRAWEEENLLLIQVIQRCRRSVHAYCLWLQDSSPVNWSYLRKSAHIYRSIFRGIGGYFSRNMNALILLAFIVGFLYSVLFAIWTSCYPHYKNALEEINLGLGRVNRDHFILTLRALLWEGFAVLPVLFLFLAPSIILELESKDLPYLHPVSEACLKTAPMAALLCYIAQLAKPHGVFLNHFRFSKEATQVTFKYWKLFSAFTCFSWFHFSLFTASGMEAYSSTLGRAYFILLCSSLTLLFKVRCLFANVPLLPVDPRAPVKEMVNRSIWATLAFISTYAGLMACRGFFETAKVILWNLEKFTLIWFVFLFLYRFIVRIMLIQRRKLLFERNLQKRAELLAQRARVQTKEESDGFPFEAEALPMLDLESLSSRSLSLVKSLVQIMGLGAFLLICSQIQPIFKAFEVPIIYDYTVTALVSIFLLGYLFYQLHQNLPSLLDLVIFPHFDCAANTRYTTKNVVRYLVTVFGILALYYKSELDTQKLQIVWAFFSGALGFGIRDLFNSLASGLLILTTKNIRIGDTVNIGSVTGTVTQISLLSTTLMDADRKEISIPNKNIMNDPFSRWPSDELAYRVNLKVTTSSEHPPEVVLNCLSESIKSLQGIKLVPEDGVLFSEISPGKFHYELRLLIADSQRQAPIRTKLYSKILTSFKNVGISHSEIAAYPMNLDA